jgi:hypothetical protein
MNGISYRQQAVKVTKLVTFALATVATAIVLPATAQADDAYRVDQGKQAYATCSYSAIGSGFGQWPALAYGQTRSLGALTCDSEPSGMTCTDGSTGHFFRISRDSY